MLLVVPPPQKCFHMMNTKDTTDVYTGTFFYSFTVQHTQRNNNNNNNKFHLSISYLYHETLSVCDAS